MSTRVTFSLLSAIVAAGSLFLVTGCSQEISHSESDKPGWFGGRTHEETTTYRNPDGTISTEHQKQSVK